MVAMRLMHAGFDAHAVGEATAPSIGRGDGLVMISGSGKTPVTLHFARLALDFGARMLAVTTPRRQSALLLLDAVILDLTVADPHAYAAMHTPARQPAVRPAEFGTAGRTSALFPMLGELAAGSRGQVWMARS
jgi:D-arabinose 5-phosphate isomerase GutQ